MIILILIDKIDLPSQQNEKIDDKVELITIQ